MNEPKKRTATQQEVRDLLDLLQERVAERCGGDGRRAQGYDYLAAIEALRKAPPDPSAVVTLELEAMRAVLEALRPLTPDQRRRVVEWATEAARSASHNPIEGAADDD